MSHRTLFTFICYKEDNDFYKNIKKLENAGYYYFIYYNSTPKQENIKHLKGDYFISKKNVGISHAINYLFKLAKSKNFEFMFFLDQDTNFSEGSFNQIFLAENFLCANKNTAAIQLMNKSDEQAVVFKKNLFIINSCSLFKIDRTFKIGLYDEEYFVELADYSFCINSTIAGFKVGTLRCLNDIDHFINQPGFNKKIFKLKLNLRVYPDNRVSEMNKSFVKLLSFCIKEGKAHHALALIKFYLLWSLKLYISKFFS